MTGTPIPNITPPITNEVVEKEKIPFSIQTKPTGIVPIALKGKIKKTRINSLLT